MNITKQNRIPEIVCFCIFIISTIFISLYHEAWHDEVHAWEISKDTIYNILFVIPHVEGHPPLWHLILKCFSVFGVSVEAAVKIPNLIFIYAAVFLLIFKSPFPKIIRLTLPFTYFIFYQYAIISRPYSVYCFALFLAAYFYKDRNTHPFRFISALSLLAFSCAFGLVLTAGIVFVWFLEVIKSPDFSIKTFIKSNKFWSMLSVFIVCLIIVCLIKSDSMIIYSTRFADKPIIKILYILFILPADTLMTNYCTYVATHSSINFLYCALGIFIYGLFFSVLKRFNTLLLFLIPYSLLIGCSFLYIEIHHFGLFTLFYIFAFWCALYNNKTELSGKLKTIFTLFLICTIGVQLYWSTCAYINDYKYDYWFSKRLAAYLKKNNTDKYYVCSEWNVFSYFYNKQTNQKLPLEIKMDEDSYKNFVKAFERVDNINFNSQGYAEDINAYLNKNIFKSFNILHPDKSYVIMKINTDEEIKQITEKMHSYGIPDLFVGNIKLLSFIFPEEELKDVYYDLIYFDTFYRIYKDTKTPKKMAVWAKSDISGNFDKYINEADNNIVDNNTGM